MRRAVVLLAFIALSLPLVAAEHREMLVSTTWLRQHLHDRQLTIVDVGDADAWAKGHIHGARFVAMSDLAIARDEVPNELPEPLRLEAVLRNAGLSDRGKIVVYSRDPVHAARAFFTLDYAGRGGDTAILDGGFAKWAAEGLPVETGAPARVTAGNFVCRPQAEAIVRLTTMKMLVACGASMAPQMAFLDARSPEQYRGDEPGSGVAYGGHIEGAINVPWNENLTSGATPQYRSLEELRNLYRYAGVEENGSVVVYCRTGMQAAVDYFALRMLGHDVHLYDGSWFEWSHASAGTATGCK
jgi:thiosulfate/3-mercaptopyruvate sulfurtransferase